MLAKDIIKIKYSQEGYLPNYPPHLISDEEMCQAFLPDLKIEKEYEENEIPIYSYFYDVYPLRNSNLECEYDELINAFRYHMSRFLSSVESFRKDLPDWVYSYMLGEVINDSSVQEDRHFFLIGINRDNMDDELTAESQSACYKVSKRWVNKLDKESKIAKLSEILSEFNEDDQSIIQLEFEQWGVSFVGIYKYSPISKETIDAIVTHTWTPSEETESYYKEDEPISLDKIDDIIAGYKGTSSTYGISDSDIEAIIHDYWTLPTYILTRPPTMYGEPDIIKLIRLNEVGEV